MPKIILAVIITLEKRGKKGKAVVMPKDIAGIFKLELIAAFLFVLSALYVVYCRLGIVEARAGPPGRKYTFSALLMLELLHVKNFGGKLAHVEVNEFGALHRARYIQSVVPVKLVEPRDKIRYAFFVAAVKILLCLVEIDLSIGGQKHSRVLIVEKSEIETVDLVIRYSAFCACGNRVVRKNKVVFGRNVIKSAGIKRRKQFFALY